MKAESWARVFALFRQTVDLEAHERGRFLESHCSDDAWVREQVDRLLRKDSESAGPLDRELSVSPLRALEPEAPPVVPESIDEFEIVRLLDAGGMGTVYEAFQRDPRRRVALKTLRRASPSASGLRRFRLEAEVLASLRHPNIAQIYRSGTHTDGKHSPAYIAMEFVPNARDLMTFVQENALRLRERIGLFLKITDAVQHAHQRGVIHCDLKPKNLLVDSRGEPKVIDFGLARVMASETWSASLAATDSGQVLGTLQYMSPEQLEGRRDVLDVRSDVYSLGVVLFQLLTGALPFEPEGSGLAAVVRAVGAGEPRRLTTIDPALKGDLEWIASKALERDVDRRYASVSELAEDVRRHLRHEPVNAGPPDQLYRLRKFARRHRLGLSVAALATLLLIGGGGATLWQAALARERLEERNVQLELANEANGFLDRVLGSLRPEIAQGDELTLRRVVERAVLDLERAPPGHPLVEAGVRLQLGRTFAALGEDAEALPHLERAVELLSAATEHEDERFLEASIALSASRLELGEFEEGERASAELLETAEGSLGREDVVTLSALILHGRALSQLSRFEEAEAELREALARTESSVGPAHAMTLSVLRELVGVEHLAGDLEGAVAAQQRLVVHTRELGALHPAAIASEANLATIQVNAGQVEAGTHALAELLPRAERVLGGDHPQVLNLHGDLAYLFAKAGRGDEALPELERLLEKLRKLRGLETASIAHVFLITGMGFFELGLVDEAEELLLAALELEERFGLKRDREAFQARLCLSAVLVHRGRLDEARELLEEATEGATKILGEEHYITLLLRNNLGRVYHGMGRPQDSRRVIEGTVAIARRVYGPDDPHQTLLAQNNYAALLRETGEYELSWDQFQDVLERRERVLGPDHNDTLQTRADLVRLHQLTGELEVAEALLRELVDDRLRVSGGRHPASVRLFNQMADLLRAQAKYSEAQEWVERAAAEAQTSGE